MKWLKDSVPAAQKRFAEELPEAIEAVYPRAAVQAMKPDMDCGPLSALQHCLQEA